MTANYAPDPVREAAIELILKKFGNLRDLSEEFRQVVWVTVYAAMSIGAKIEEGGGARAITKSILLDHGKDARELESSLNQLKFVTQMIHEFRSSNASDAEFAAQMAVDVLKWRMEEAPNMSVLVRMVVRRFSKADKAYGMRVPRPLYTDEDDAPFINRKRGG